MFDHGPKPKAGERRDALEKKVEDKKPPSEQLKANKNNSSEKVGAAPTSDKTKTPDGS